MHSISCDDAYAWATASSVNLSGALMLLVFVVVFVCAHVHDNYSWVDRSWSIVPVVYAWIHTAYAYRDPSTSGGALTKSSVFTGIITLWGIRLTFNFYRRGGYFRGGEDYRWNYVHTWPILRSVPVVWVLFNLLVISLFQTVLLWAITLPLCAIPATPMVARDWLFAALIAACLVLETQCDNEQWRYQNRKRQAVAVVAQDPALRFGFCVTGVFGYSRHLNVACESLIWIGLALAAYSQSWQCPPWWQLSGCVALQLLTLFSTGIITERLTRQKYPLYAVYQSTTPMLWPTTYSTTQRALFLLNRAEAKQRGVDEAGADW